MDPTHAMTRLRLSLKKDVELRDAPDASPCLEGPPFRLPLGEPSGLVHRLAEVLLKGNETLAGLSNVFSHDDGPQGPMRAMHFLQQLDHLGWLCRTVPLSVDEPAGTLAKLVPVSQPYVFHYAAPEPGRPYVLSRFAWCRRVGHEMWLESGRSHAHIVLHDPRAAALLHRLSSGATLEEMTAENLCGTFSDPKGELGAEAVSMFLGLLLGAEMVHGLDEQDGGPDDSTALRQWTFHDLLFHSRNRLGRHAEPFGKTEPFKGNIEPLPALKPTMSEAKISLHVPDLEDAAQHEVSLTRAMESRRSVRRFGSRAMSVHQLGELLYRTVRSEPAPDAGSRSYDHDRRPYPSGGSCNELELYIVANRCEGLEPGLYHFHPGEHALFHLSELDAKTRELLLDASRATGSPVGDDRSSPQVLIILAARFQRVSWAYEAIAYSLILKHAGVLYQSICLVATAMGLGACPLGAGNADTFAAATGLSYLVEGSVGELILGSLEEPADGA